MTRKYNKRGGMPNYVFNPTLYSSSYGRIAGVGCPQQSSNILAANAQFGGSSVYCPATNPLATPITGPAAGPAAVVACEPFNGKRSLQMGGVKTGGSRRRRQRGGKISGDTDERRAIGTSKYGNFGGSRRRRRRRRGGVSRYPSAPGKKGGRGGGRRGTKSKTHRGKNYETRKSSKRYRSGKFKKYLRGRKTMRAPDFPFAGGALQAPPSLSNIPYAPGYSTGSQLTPNLSALANPVPYKAYNHCQSN